MSEIVIIFPHQLFKDHPLLDKGWPIFLVEEQLFFKQYNFHKQKIAFHRASMKFYESYLQQRQIEVTYINSFEEISSIRKLIPYIKKRGIFTIHCIEVVDNWLDSRISKKCEELTIELIRHQSPMFLNSIKDLASFFRGDKKKYHQTSFYIEQRKKRAILLDADQKPTGGKWSFDKENRKKYPAKKIAPPVYFPDVNSFYEEATSYVAQYYSKNLGTLTAALIYPNTFETAQRWLFQFLENRFHQFGTYEDAIVAKTSILNHSVLTPMLNTGLLTPQQIIDFALDFAQENKVPINSTEGFIRQIIGWREFIRGMYHFRGSDQRSRHFWLFTKKIPSSFYKGTTGILPVDEIIKKVLKTGYCHHIERLMVLGNFMLLCEFDPDEVYKWFMELFIDAYDWVMVPNVYGMSQFADGGLMATKPYISGSNYLLKMSDYTKGDWQEVWDGLFWRFMHQHRIFFESNPRLGMLVRMFDKMPLEKRQQHLLNANNYLDTLVPS